MSRFLVGLNPEQQAAVAHANGPLVVLAGAGSGKTRVITHRIARLIEAGVRPWQILAVTFTNKAAGEMLERLRHLAGEEAAGEAWVSTFHAAGVRILRRDGYKLGLPRAFTILDEKDQLSLVKRLVEELGIGERTLLPKEALARIDHFKNQGVLPAQAMAREDDPAGAAAVRVYRRYEDALQAQGAVDFGDLLLRVVELLRASPQTRDYYRRRFLHLLVDEFQDTNPVQYELLRLLCPDDRRQANLCVVGDDDQSIYRWRGAEVRNILRFGDDFPGAVVVKLERNYRSTPRILEAAHAVISRNVQRAPKKLWTEGEPGEKLRVHTLVDDRQEALRVGEVVSEEHARGTSWGEIAVFYRTNAQSRLVEEALRMRQVPYVVVRGTSFYDRAEVRDVLAWLRLVVNPRGDTDFLRAVGAPPRGIGDTTLDKLAAHARARGVSLWEAALLVDETAGLTAGVRGKVKAFVEQIRSFTLRAQSLGAGEVAGLVAEETGFLARLSGDPRGEGEERRENVQELVRAAKEFDESWRLVTGEGNGTAAPVRGLVRPEASVGAFSMAQLAALKALRGDEDTPAPTPLEAFLAALAVLGDADTPGGDERVSLMTLHAAKGLEFDAVFIVGLEERVFPTARALDDEEAIAEERRLCYVGITRARQRVHLSLARQRALFGELKLNPPSRFLLELPAEHTLGLDAILPPERARPEPARREGRWIDRDELPAYDDERPRPPPRLVPPSRPAERAPTGPSGARVRHPKFGEGRVLSSRGSGPDAKLTVSFASVGPKVVVARFLEPLD